MYDAWGTRPHGIYSGNVVDFGNFEQCYNFVHHHPLHGRIQGQNCVIPVQMKNVTLTIPEYRMSVCVPASCQPSDIRNLLQSHFSREGLFIPEYNTLNTCEVKQMKNNYSTSYWIAITFFIIFLTLVTTSTIYDTIIRYLAINSKAIIKPRASLISFSIYTNMMHIFNYGDTDKRKQQITLLLADGQTTTFTSLNCLNGLRVLSTLWVIYQHTYYMQLSFPLINENYKYQVCYTNIHVFDDKIIKNIDLHRILFLGTLVMIFVLFFIIRM